MNSEIVEQIKETARNVTGAIHTAIPGEIVSYDPSKGQATVRPIMKYTTKGGSLIAYLKITGVPVLFQQHMGQQATVAFPVKPGDGCLLVVSEQSLDYWMFGQETGTDLRFDLTNAVCIPGLFVPANTVVAEACDQDAVIADTSGTRITIKSDGNIIMDAKLVTINADVRVNGKVTASGDVISEDRVSGAHHTHPGCSGGSTGQPG